MKISKVIIGCDHAGYNLKLQVLEHLKEKGVEFVDVGTNSPESCHYPEIAHAVCTKVQAGEAPVGILICGTGIGMSMAANKHRRVRAALCSETYSARFTRMHNNANILCMGARVIGPGLAQDITDIFLATEFESGGRHEARVDMITAIEEAECKR